MTQTFEKTSAGGIAQRAESGERSDCSAPEEQAERFLESIRTELWQYDGSCWARHSGCLEALHNEVVDHSSDGTRPFNDGNVEEVPMR